MSIKQTFETRRVYRIDTPEEVAAWLQAATPPGPSLHPRTVANGGDERSWGKNSAWNGWNLAWTTGWDAAGQPIKVTCYAYASGHHGLSAGIQGETPYGGGVDFVFQGIAFPVRLEEPTARVLHPEHTPPAPEPVDARPPHHADLPGHD